MWKKGVFGTVLAAFLGYVAWVAFFSSTRHEIEWDIATRVSSVLERTGFDEVMPVVEGRDIELQGVVATHGEAERAERIVSALPGVRIVDSQLLVAGDATAAQQGGDK
jgi:hypothetical protein